MSSDSESSASYSVKISEQEKFLDACEEENI